MKDLGGTIRDDLVFVRQLLVVFNLCRKFCMTFIVSLKYSTGMKQIFFRVCWNSRVFENLADSKTDYIFKQALDILQRERRYTMLMDLTSCDAIRGKLDEAKCPLLSASFIMKD